MLLFVLFDVEPIFRGVIVSSILCNAVMYVQSNFAIISLAEREREGLLLDFDCLLDGVWLLVVFVSSSRCCGFVCSLRLWHFLVILIYIKACVKRPLSKRSNNGFQDRLSLNAGQKYLQYCRPSLNYHLSLRSLLCLFLSGRFTPVLLYCFATKRSILLNGSTTMDKIVVINLKKEQIVLS